MEKSIFATTITVGVARSRTIHNPTQN